MSEEEATNIAIKVDADTYMVKENYSMIEDQINEKGIEILDKIKFNLLERKFKEDLLG